MVLREYDAWVTGETCARQAENRAGRSLLGHAESNPLLLASTPRAQTGILPVTCSLRPHNVKPE